MPKRVSSNNKVYKTNRVVYLLVLYKATPMFRSLILSLYLFTSSFYAAAQEYVEQFRQQYPSARTDATVCEKQIAVIDGLKTFTPLQRAYAGAFYAVWPEHLQSPLKKLNAFKKGKSYLEQAIREDPGNTEIHFLRLTVQHNAPAMLGYNDNKDGDLKIVLENYKKTKSPILRAHIKDFLLPTDLLSPSQRKMLD